MARRDSGIGSEEIQKVGSGVVRVEVIDGDRKEKNKKYAVYKVSISSSEGKPINVAHRYNEYLTLCNKLKKKYPELQIKLPGKKLFVTVDSEMVQARRVAIQDMFEKLLADPTVFQSADVQLFFTLRSSRPSSYETDDEAYYSMNPSVQSSRRNSIGCEEMMLKQNRTKPSDFEFLKVVGNGSFGKVYLARHLGEQKTYAVKVLNKQKVIEKNEARHVMCERQVLATNNQHPFLVALHYSFQTADKLYLVMDYINGGELFFHLQREKRFSEVRVRFYGAEIASALGFLHSQNIIYRDLKPENVLLDAEGHVALTDFGLCKGGKLQASTFCGTAEYLAPEVLQQKPYDQMVDWWCLGAVMYELMLGLPPFYSKNRAEMYEMTLNNPLQFRHDVLTDSAKDLLNKLLTKDKSERLGSHADVQDIKQHSFFKSIDWEQLEQRKIKPPFIPNLKEDSLDTSNFDQQFTKLPVTESVSRTTKYAPGGATSRLFEDFSYKKVMTSQLEDEICCF